MYRGTLNKKSRKSYNNCAHYEEEWEYCFRLGTHVPKNGYCENYCDESSKEEQLNG